MFVVEPRLGAASGDDETQTGNDRVVSDGVAGRCREGVAPLVDNGSIAGVGLQPAANRLWPRRLSVRRFHALVTPRVAGFWHFAKGFQHVNPSPAFFGE